MQKSKKERKKITNKRSNRCSSTIYVYIKGRNSNTSEYIIIILSCSNIQYEKIKKFKIHLIVGTFVHIMFIYQIKYLGKIFVRITIIVNTNG